MSMELINTRKNKMTNHEQIVAAYETYISENEKFAGKGVKVAYTEADGKMTATKITVAPEKVAAPAKTEKKEEPKKEEAKK